MLTIMLVLLQVPKMTSKGFIPYKTKAAILDRGLRLQLVLTLDEFHPSPKLAAAATPGNQ
jgi:hypothetical protein